MSKSHIHTKLENHFSDTIRSSHAVGGGCIANAQIVSFQSGFKLFLKSGFSNGMFQNEANGLTELRKANAIRIPKVLMVEDDFLALECIESGNKKADFFSILGKQFAQMHRYTAEHFGFYENNFIGSNPQINSTDGKDATDWKSFYWNKRILFQLELAEKNGYSTPELRKALLSLEDKLNEIIGGSKEAPCVLHGDLWGGNYMVDEKGNPVLIDPAVYYGHREADLAMTALFGGFTPEFYQAYQNEYPLKEGWKYRQNLYKLYHVLNHLNLFGSGYYGQAMQLIKFYG